MKRPELKIGDICRLSKKGKAKYKITDWKNATFEVKFVGEISSEAHTRVAVKAVYSINTHTVTSHKIMERQYLWYTGRNKLEIEKEKKVSAEIANKQLAERLTNWANGDENGSS